MDDEGLAIMRELQNDVNEERSRRIATEHQSAATMFSSESNENLIKFQLDIKEELERIEHLLRKHVPKIDSKGNQIFVESPKVDQIFNERGINEILIQLNWYLTKNIILSNYEEEEITVRMKQFSLELNDFIWCNYKVFGLDTIDKVKHYPIVHMNIINTVEAAYHRALGGSERDSLRTARMVNQAENLNQNPIYPVKSSKFSLLKPSTW